MFNFQRIEPLPHIAIEREPDERPIRFRPFPGAPKVHPRDNRQEHADTMKQQTQTSTEELSRLRATFGIDPRLLLVLRLESLDVDQQEVIEKLGVTILEELTEKRDTRTVNRVLVQFPDDQALQAFMNEYDRYAESAAATTVLPQGQRRDFFDSLDSVSLVAPAERQGRRLQRDGAPNTTNFFLDVDLWNPGTDQAFRNLMTSFSQFVQSRGGRVVRDQLRIPSLVLVKVQANRQLLNDLLQLDLVSLVDLPPQPLPEDSFDLFQTVNVSEPLPPIPNNGPLACIVDSGVISGHPLLRGIVVGEEDFDSGEGTSVDRNGHGTEVAGFVVYGDIARRLVNNEWNPQVRLCSAKVLRHRVNPLNPTNGFAEFPEEERVEEQLRKAIEYFHREHGCRIFNLSIGHGDRPYFGGRQLPWAELLDEMAKRLDIVIVVSAGNVIDPALPAGVNSQQLQQTALQSLNGADHHLIDPATAALCLTVGSVARRDDPTDNLFTTRLAASPAGCPSPFTRCGPGVAGAVKPELVAPGGNFVLDASAGQVRWNRQDPNLSEPALNHDFATGRLLRATCGTSASAPQVAHIAARVEASLREQLQAAPTANLIRALVVNSARVDDKVKEWLGDSQETILKTVGYGQPKVEACWSSPNRTTLIAEDIVPYKTFHVYSLRVPDAFLETKGNRSITVTLAYDPPTRLSRKDYIANAMWLEVYRGLTTEQVFEYRSKYDGDGEPPKAPDANKLAFKPGGLTIKMSTVQSRSWHSNQGTKLDHRPTQDSEATFHIFVGCQPQFPNPLGEDRQRYALVVTLEHENQQINLYQEIRTRVRARARVRVSGA